MKPKICVLIPTLDNAATLRDVVQGVLPKGYPVLVVDDGSRVPAAALLADVAGDLHVLRHATNRGKGAALCTGFAWARENGFTHVISLDADGQHLPEDVPTLANVPFVEHGHDLCELHAPVLRIVGEIEGADAKFVDHCAGRTAGCAPQHADAGEIGAGKMDFGGPFGDGAHRIGGAQHAGRCRYTRCVVQSGAGGAQPHGRQEPFNPLETHGHRDVG